MTRHTIVPIIDTPFSFSKLAFACALALPMSAFGDTQLVADGESKEVSEETYEHSNQYQGAVHANNGGRIVAENINAIGHGDFVQGVSSQNGSNVVYKGGTITTDGRGGVAVGVNFDADAEFDNVDIRTSGRSASGVSVEWSGNVRLDNSSIETSGLGSAGLSAANEGSAELDNVKITTTGDGSAGISVRQIGTSVDVKSTSISTSGNNSLGVAAENGATGVIDGSTVVTSGNGSIGLVARTNARLSVNDSSIKTGGDGAHGAYVTNNAQVEISNSDISTSGTSAHGLVIWPGGGRISLSGSQVRVEGAGSSAILSQSHPADVNRYDISDSALIAQQAAAILVEAAGHTDISLKNSSVESGVGELFSGTSITGSSSLSADASNLMGNISIVSSAFDADFAMANGSYWSGAGNGINTLSLDNSGWLMTGNSTTRNLSLNSGSVSFDQSDGAYKTLTTGTLSGNGRFLMNTDLANLQGDMLVVQDTGMATGNHQLVVGDAGYEPLNGDGRLKLVDTNGGDAKFDLYGGHVDAGAFRYGLEQDGDDWFLARSAGKEPEELSKGANAAVAAHSANASLWSAQMNALVKRLGELRMGKDDGGVWTRGISKRYDVSENSSRAYTQNVTGIEIGADKAIAMDTGKVYLGAMVGTASAKLNFGEGASGNTDSKMVGVYATYLNDNGVYVDSVLKHSQFDNDIKMSTNLGTPVKSSYKTRGVGADIEVGKHIKLGEGWFVEPQLELTATRTQGGKYTASNGLSVKSDDVDSLQSRVGSLFGRSLELSNGMKAQPYVKASYITEHAGSSKVSVNGNKIDAELPGNRVELGFGGVLQVSEKSKISLDAEYAKGNSIEQPWGLNLGYRYLW